MTSPAIKLARECGAVRKLSAGNQAQLIIFGEEELERFHAKAQAQALRDAADLVQDDYGCDVDSAAKIRRMAEELERGA